MIMKVTPRVGVASTVAAHGIDICSDGLSRLREPPAWRADDIKEDRRSLASLPSRAVTGPWLITLAVKLPREAPVKGCLAKPNGRYRRECSSSAARKAFARQVSPDAKKASRGGKMLSPFQGQEPGCTRVDNLKKIIRRPRKGLAFNRRREEAT